MTGLKIVRCGWGPAPRWGCCHRFGRPWVVVRRVESIGFVSEFQAYPSPWRVVGWAFTNKGAWRIYDREMRAMAAGS